MGCFPVTIIWFAAIDNQSGRDNRRIGFYLEEPDAGSTDSGTPGQHPTNARFYVDITGSYVASGGFHVTDANFDVESNGNVSIGGAVTSQGNPIISQSGDFVNNEFIVAVGKYAVTSSDDRQMVWVSYGMKHGLLLLTTSQDVIIEGLDSTWKNQMQDLQIQVPLVNTPQMLVFM